MVGTPYYMSPEQAFGAPEELDHRTDLYSLGAVLYEMLTGRPPFEGATVLSILRKIEDEDPPPAGISARVDAMVARALAKDRERRFQSAAEMAEAIKACLSEETAPESPVTTSAPAPAMYQVERRTVWAAAGALAAAFAGILTWSFWPKAPPPPPPEPPKAVVHAPPPPDPAAELRALLARKTEVTAPELKRYREDPLLRRMIAEHYMKRGQFSRALEDLRGYEKAIMELASAKALQRFVSPALFRVSIAQPRDMKGPEAFLMAALGRHLEGKTDAARQKLKAATNNDAFPAHALLVRAHIDLIDVMQSPGDENAKKILADLRRDLDRTNELYLLPMRAIAAQLAGDGYAARDCANLLLRSAPSSAETFLTSAVLFLKAGRIDLAADEVDEAVRMDSKGWDSSILRVYLRWLEVLNDPENARLETSAEGKMDLAEMREALDERLRHDHYPAALLLRAALSSLDGKWEPAEEDLGRLGRRINDRWDLITVDHERLAAFAQAAGSRSRLLSATADLQLHLGRRIQALATSELIKGEDLPNEDERRELLRNNHMRMARLHRSRIDKALWHLEQALKLGQPPKDVREDNELGELRQRAPFDALLKRYEN